MREHAFEQAKEPSISKQASEPVCDTWKSHIPPFEQKDESQLKDKNDTENVPKTKRTLRNIVEKRKSDSFIYPPLKKKTKTYCLCGKEDDHRKYMQCDSCKTWYHPDCVGYKDVPQKYLCNLCSTKESEQVLTAESFKEMHPAVMKKINDIMECSDLHCKKKEHSLHHEFLSDPRGYIIANKMKISFGEAYVTSEEYEDICLMLHTRMVRDILVEDVYSLPAQMFKNITDKSMLYKILVKHRTMALDYVFFVLRKDFIILTVSTINSMPYEEVKENCLNTEMDMRQFFSKKKW